MSSAFRKFATVTCATKRLAPIDAGGKREEASLHLVGLRCTPLDPVDEEIRREAELSKPFQALQTFLEGDLDIREKDVLVVGDVEYVVRAAGAWQWDAGTKIVRLIIEDARVI